MTSTSRHAQFDDRAFGHRLRIARIVLGVTEREAAAAVGRTLPTWRNTSEPARDVHHAPAAVCPEVA